MEDEKSVIWQKQKQQLEDCEKVAIISAIDKTFPYEFFMPVEGELLEFIDGYRDGSRDIQRRIVEWANGLIAPEVTNKFIGIIHNSRSCIKNVLNHARGKKFRGPLKVLIYQHMNEILRDAVLFDQREDRKQYFYNLAHNLLFEGQPYIATISVIEDKRNGNRVWTVEFVNKKKIAKTPTMGYGAAVNNTAAKPTSSQPVSSILQSLFKVNQKNISIHIDPETEEPDLSHGLEV